MVADRDALPGLIALYRTGKAGARDALLTWLHAYVGDFIKLADPDDRDDLQQDIVAYLCEGLPEILASVDLEREPYRYIWKVVHNRFLHAHRALRKNRVVAQHLDEMEAAEFSAHHPWRFPRPEDIVAGRELKRVARKEAARSVHTFRFPRWRGTYATLVESWLKHGREPYRGFDTSIPKVVVYAMRVHLRRSIERAKDVAYGGAA